MSTERIEDMLVDWELARQRGEELTAEDLFKLEDAPDSNKLLETLRARIAALKATSWMIEDPADEDFSDVAPAADDSADISLSRRDIDVSREQFLNAILKSGLLDDPQVSWLRRLVAQYDPQITAHNLAKRLVEEGVLTSYQASVLLTGKKSPLVLDRYVILDTLGAGGMGVVYKALHRAMERVVALKVLPRHAVDSPIKVNRFLREIKAVARLNHPNIVTAYDAYQKEKLCFLVMEYVEGRDLKRTVLEDGPLDLRQAVTIIYQIASALGAAHKAGIIHRDVKPSNILLSIEGVPKLLDLGLARTREETQHESNNNLTREGLAMGTAAYMAPEQARDPRQADARSDVYSLGCTLYFLLVGKPLFEKDSSLETILAHLEEQTPSLSDAKSEISEDLETAFERMVAKHPSDRLASMDEVCQLLKSTGVVAASAVEPAEISSSPSTSKTPLIVAAAVALVALVVGFFVMQGSSRIDSAVVDRAKWALNSGNIVIAETAEGLQTFRETSDLPNGIFRIVGFQLIDPDEVQTLNPIFAENHLQMLTLVGFPREKVPLEQFVKLSELFKLRLVRCGLRDEDIKWLLPLTALRELDLGGNDQLSDAAVQEVSKLAGLEAVDFASAEVTPYGLKFLSGFQELRSLGLEHCPVGDLRELPSLPHLVELKFSPTNLNQKVVNRLAALPKLEVLDVSTGVLDDLTLFNLAELSGLKELYVSSEQVSTRGIERFKKLLPECEVVVE